MKFLRMRFCGLLVLLLSFFQLSAKTISGVVLSDRDSTAVSGAVCRLLNGTQLITGCTADQDGVFSVQTDVKTDFTLEIGFIGFKTTEILINSGNKDISLGEIYLAEGVALDEVTVTAASRMDVRGRTIVYPESADVKASSTSLSLFQKLPLAGLEANPIKRTLSVDGGVPVILINGVPSSIDDVNAIKPGDIAKIEFSRVTPARYADKGNSGFINITLKQRNDGGDVYFWGRSAVTTAFMDGNLRASYHQGSSQFTLAYVPSWRNYQKVYDSASESYVGDDFRVNLEEKDRNPFNYHYHQMRLKYDYSPDEHTLFSATFRAIPNFNKRRMIRTTSDSELGEYDNYNFSKDKNFAPSLDLFFRRDFNEKNTIEAQVVGTLSTSDYRRDNKYVYSDGSEENYIMNVDSRRRSLISEISYIHNFSDKTSLSGGYQNTVSNSTNTYLSSDYKPELKENNNYIYARLGQQVGKVYFSLATGVKMFWIENDMNKRNFVRNLTNILASWNINSSWGIQASFRYSPSIPSLTSLTDYPQQVSPYLMSNGNPELKVAEYFNYRVSANYQYKKFSASFNSGFTDAKHAVIGDVTYLGDRLFLSQSVNARKQQVFQNDLSLKISGLSGFGVNLNMGLSYYECAGAGWSHDLTSFNASVSLWYNNGPYTVSYWRKFPGKYLSGHIVGKDENGDALSFEYELGKHWNIGVDWMYMFDKRGTKYPSWSYSSVNPAYIDRYIKNNGNMVVLSIRYSADFGSIFRSARRSLNNSDSGSSLLKL